MREAVDLADVGRDPLLALRGVGGGVGRPDLLAVHGGDVRAAEVPAYAYDAAGEPVARVRPSASRTDHPSTHEIPAFRASYARIIPLTWASANAGRSIRREQLGGPDGFRADKVLAAVVAPRDRTEPLPPTRAQTDADGADDPDSPARDRPCVAQTDATPGPRMSRAWARPARCDPR